MLQCMLEQRRMPLQRSRHAVAAALNESGIDGPMASSAMAKLRRNIRGPAVEAETGDDFGTIVKRWRKLKKGGDGT